MTVFTAARPGSEPLWVTQARGGLPAARGSRLSEDELAALVTAAAAGSEIAWERLVRELGGLLWAVARTFRLGDADAADVVQATWVRLLEHLDRLTEPGRVGAWIATTARRECLRVLRDRGRQIPTDDDPRAEVSGDPAPELQLLVGERDRELWQAFNRLRPSDQALLRLLLADPRPAYEDISAALNIPIGSIGPTRARALERLRRELGDCEELVI
jgi:RNA polymerase sigma factor (sigma-70 family)